MGLKEAGPEANAVLLFKQVPLPGTGTPIEGDGAMAAFAAPAQRGSQPVSQWGS